MAERMATVGRLSLKVAHEVRNPIAAIELNAELLRDIVQGPPRDGHGRSRRAGHGHPRPGERARRAHRGVPGLRALSAGRSSRRTRSTTWWRRWRSSCVRVATRQGIDDQRDHRPDGAADGSRSVAPAPGGAQPPQERARGALARGRAHAEHAAGTTTRVEVFVVSDTGSRHHRRRSAGGCSSSSSPPSRRARASACPSPGRSSRSTAAS